MKTIIHFSQDFQRNKQQLGGYSRILNICSDSNNHIIFTLDQSNKQIVDWKIRDNITVVAIPLLGKPFTRRQQLLSFKYIAQQILVWLKEKEISPSLLFGHSQLINYFILKEVKNKLGNILLIWELNVIWGIHPVKGIVQKILLEIIFYLQKRIIRESDYLITQTRSSKQFIIKTFKAEEAKISVVENAIMPEDIINKEKLIVADDCRFLCFGLFDRMNGIPFLLETARSFTNKFQIDFWGNGPYLNDVKLNAEMGVVNYKGSLTREQMLRVLRKYTFVIIPRLPEVDADLFIPTKLIECMANGVIPICSDVMGMKELVKHGQNGFLFEAGNGAALKKLLEQVANMPEEKLIEISTNAIDTTKSNYTWDVKHQTLNDIYDKLIKENSSLN